MLISKRIHYKTQQYRVIPATQRISIDGPCSGDLQGNMVKVTNRGSIWDKLPLIITDYLPDLCENTNGLSPPPGLSHVLKLSFQNAMEDPPLAQIRWEKQSRCNSHRITPDFNFPFLGLRLS